MPVLPKPIRIFRTELSVRLTLLCVALLAVSFAGANLIAQEQDHSEDMEGEMVANLAAGRVVIAVVRDGMVIASLENKIEPATRVPPIIPLGSRRAGILLGAVDWATPTAGLELARLSVELPQLRRESMPAGPRLRPGGTEVTSEVEMVGLGLLERLRAIVEHLHGKLDVAPEEPVLELILASDDPDYGSEVWLLEYAVTQEPARGDYWQTLVKRPSYHRLWPPEKGQPRTLVEVRYPPENNEPTLQDALKRNDGSLEKIRAGDPALAAVATAFEKGESQKCSLADATQFLRSAFAALAPPNTGEAVAVISDKTGFEWILEPPKEKEKKPRPPGAPTLQKPSN
jgi:hypothetical protein